MKTTPSNIVSNKKSEINAMKNQISYLIYIRKNVYERFLVLFASLLCAASANAATLNEWLFDAPATGASFTAVNEVTGGSQVNEQNTGVSFQNLQVAGGPFYSSVGGEALHLTGTNYSATGASLTDWTGRTSLTIELWVNPASNIGGSKDVFSDSGQLLRLDPSGLGFILTGFIHDGSGYHSATGSTVILTDVWTHLALTYDGSTINTYVGSALDGTASYSTSSLTGDSTGLLSIGMFSFANFFIGDIDEVRQSDVALLPGNGSGVGTLAWNASLAVPEPGQVALMTVGGLMLLMFRRMRRRE